MKNLINTQTKLAKFVFTASFFALSCVGIGATAQAQEATGSKAPAEHSAASVTYPVRYSDLDVSTAKGAKILYLRIRYAAETLCESTATWGKKEGEVCVNKSVNDAVARVGAPLLTQYSQLRNTSDKAGRVHLANAN